MFKKLSCAEELDRFLTRVAMVALLTGLVAGAEALQFLVDASLASYLDLGQKVLRALLLALVLLILATSVPRLFRHKRALGHEPEGFINNAFKKACTSSWAVSVLLVAAIEPVSKRLPLELPVSFFSSLLMAVMFGVFAVTFFVVNRDQDNDLPIGEA